MALRRAVMVLLAVTVLQALIVLYAIGPSGSFVGKERKAKKVLLHSRKDDRFALLSKDGSTREFMRNASSLNHHRPARPRSDLNNVDSLGDIVSALRSKLWESTTNFFNHHHRAEQQTYPTTDETRAPTLRPFDLDIDSKSAHDAEETNLQFQQTAGRDGDVLEDAETNLEDQLQEQVATNEERHGNFLDDSQNIEVPHLNERVATGETDVWNDAKTKRKEELTPAREKTPRSSMDTLWRQEDLELLLRLPKRNRPFTEAYAFANLSFQLKVSDSLRGWRPSPDSYKFFQYMDHTDLWLYSAFRETVSGVHKHGIKVFGLLRVVEGVDLEPESDVLICHMHVANEDGTVSVGTVRARAKLLPEHHYTRVRPVSILCRHHDGVQPFAVSISKSRQGELTNMIHVYTPRPVHRNFTVCYAALHSNFNDTSQFVQSIELNKLMGAEHFMVYNFSISYETDRVLRFYESRGELTVLQWPLPTVESWYFGQLVAINDCVHRNRNESRYVVVVDTDEFIIPREGYTWSELMATLEGGHGWVDTPQDTQDGDVVESDTGDELASPDYFVPALYQDPETDETENKPIGSFVFRSAFYFERTRPPDKDTLIPPSAGMSEDSVEAGLTVLQHLQRNANIRAHEERSKTIVRPDLIRTAGIHYVFFHKKALPAFVTKEMALVHHYRRMGGRRKTVQDFTGLRYKDALLGRVKYIFSALELSEV